MDIDLSSDVKGVQAAQLIRQRDDVPIVFLTTSADEAALQRAHITEPFGYVLKPFDDHDIHSALSMALYKHTADRQLTASEERLRHITDNMTDVIAQADARGKFVYLSPSLKSMLGYNDAELLGKSMFVHVHPGDRLRAIGGMATAVRAAGPISMEVRYRHADGHYVWLETSGVPSFDEAGQIVGCFLSSRDITTHKRAEEALHESQERYRDLFENANDLIQSVDAAGHLLYVNRAWRETLGYADDDIAYLSIFDIIAPDCRDECGSVFRRLMAGEIIDRVETTFITKDGHLVELEGSANCQIVDGQPVATRGIFRDITDRKRAEAAMRRQQDEQKMIFDTLPALIWYLNHESRVQWSNQFAERMVSLPRDQLVGKTVFDLFPADEAARFHADNLEVLTTGRPKMGIIEAYHAAAGEMRWVRTDKLPNRDAAGRMTGVIVFSVDITDQKHAEEALQRQSRMLQALYETSLAINSQRDLSILLHAIVERAAQLVNAHMGSIYLMQPDGVTLKLTISYNLPGEHLGITLRLGEGVSGRVAQSGQPLMIDDHRVWPGRADVYRDSPFRRVLAVPLKVRAAVIGVINITDDQQTGLYSDDELRLVQLFADQAAIAIDTARLLEAERAQRLLAEALRDTAAALNSTLDLDEVLERILANVERVLPHDAANLMLIENGEARVVASRGFAERGVGDLVARVRFTVSDVPNMRNMAETGQPLAIPDTRRAPGWVATPEIAWAASHAGAPMRVKDNVIGFLNLDSATPGFYAQLQAERLQAFANQAAIAIENARLFDAAQRRLAAQTALIEAGRAITSSLDLTTILNRVAEQMGRAIDATSVYISDWNSATGATVVLADYYGPEASEQERESDLNVVYDVARDFGEDYAQRLRAAVAVFAYDDESTLPEPMRIHLDQYGGRSVFVIALIVKDEVIGYVELWDSRRWRHFTPDEVALCQGIAQQAALAIQNARLYEAGQRRLTEQAALIEASRAISSSLDLHTILNRVAEQMLRAIDVTSVYICDWKPEDGTATVLADVYSSVAAAAERQPAIGSVYHLIEDFGDDLDKWLLAGRPFISQVDDPNLYEPARQHMLQYGGRSALTVPLVVKGISIGYVDLWDSRRKREFPADEIALAQGIAQQAALAIENAQLYDTIRHHAAELEQHVAERTAELASERNRLQAILDSAGDGIYFVDRQRIIQYMNPAMEHLTGYSLAETVGHTPPDLWRTSLTPRDVLDDLDQCVMRGESWRGEMINRRKDGTLYDMALTVAPIRNAAGETIGFANVQRDITHLKELNRLKDQFVTRIGHELRTPLTNLIVYLDLLEHGKPDKRAKYMATLHREADRLKRLVEGFLRISDLDAKSSPLVRGPTDLNLLIEDVAADRRASADEHGLALTAQRSPAMAFIQTDTSLLYEAITCLVDNALAYTPRGGHVTLIVSQHAQDDALRYAISVRDDGAGLAPEDWPHLFERFYRGAAARDYKTSGIGLGLAICKAIVDQLGGRITVESQAGRGANFTLWLR
jgi:PAS domain S-box-containing protein